MRIETLRPTPENKTSGDKTPNYPPKGQRFIEANRGFYRKHGIEFRFSPYRFEGYILVNPDGSPITRNIDRERQEINAYLHRQDPPYQDTLQEIHTSLPPMDQGCRIAVSIPAHKEQKCIFNTLEQWANQQDLEGNPLPPHMYEINVNVNGPENYQKDDTVKEIERFRREYPGIKVNMIDVEFAVAKGNVGMARKLMADLILLRSVNRDGQDGPLYIETGDSDMVHIDPKTLAKRMKTLDDSPQIDAVVGTNDYQPELLMEHDLAFFHIRRIQIWKRLIKAQRLRPDQGNEMFDFNNLVPTNGWNTAFTAEAYALAGGFPASEMQEDYDLGLRIGLMRGFDEDWNGCFNSQTVVASPLRMHASPRRTIFALATETNPYEDFADSASMHSIRDMAVEDSLQHIPNSRISEDNVHKFEEELQQLYTWTRKVLHDPQDRELIFNQALVFLGFGKHAQKGKDGGEIWSPDCIIDDEGNVRIQDIGNIKAVLNRYRIHH